MPRGEVGYSQNKIIQRCGNLNDCQNKIAEQPIHTDLRYKVSLDKIAPLLMEG